MLNILIVDDEANIRKTLSLALEIEGHSVIAVGNGKDALVQAGQRPFDLLFLDLRLGTEKGTDYIGEFIATSPWIKIVVFTAYATVETAVEAMKLGAFEYLPKPFTPDQIRSLVARTEESKRTESRVSSLSAVHDGIEGNDAGMDMDSRSHGMRRMLTLARQVAPTEAGVLIRGESGTGKSVLARLIHAWSGRAARPFGAAEKYFHPRPSAAGNGYDAANSGGSNLGPTSQKQFDAVKERVAAYRKENGLADGELIPADAVTASGSGLDPEISPANARLQAGRVARARGWESGRVEALVREHTRGRGLGILGDPGVNVLMLNLALDETK